MITKIMSKISFGKIRQGDETQANQPKLIAKIPQEGGILVRTPDADVFVKSNDTSI